jgi:adenine-specific DNA-methyltransferase
MSSSFLNWAGKAERHSFNVPTLPLFVHERLSTEAILKSVQTHKQQLDLFADTKLDLAERVLRAYEHKSPWVNRLILGDSLVVMNSLLKYESLAGQVKCIYLDPPYGVKFGGNFQPFIRKRDVRHNDDADMTREPEMVQAYRDTWELGLHSYLTYLRDRFVLCRELLTAGGSIFVQISDDNVHHVRELLDEVFGAENAVVTIVLKKKGVSTLTDPVNDFILWYARDKEAAKPRFKRLFERRKNPEDDPKFNTLISPQWEMKRIGELKEGEAEQLLNKGWKWARVNYPLVSQDENERSKDFVWRGKSFKCGRNRHWTYDPDVAMHRLADANRLFDSGGESLGGVVFWDDWPYIATSNVWDDLKGEENPVYVVQTAWKAIQRCILISTDPGDLVLDPTCGSGTTAYMAEHWGRRWITIDTSRVPLALTRQRLLTATYPYYKLFDDAAGVSGGFKYERKRNSKGEEVGGLAPRITLKSIANDEPTEEQLLVDRPTEAKRTVRVTGPFVVEATIPTPANGNGEAAEERTTDYASFLERMLEALRRSPVLRLPNNQTVTFKNVRQPAKTLSLNAEAEIVTKTVEDLVEEADTQKSLEIKSGPLAAFLFGPENGAVTEQMVFQAAKEAYGKSYRHLYVIGFAVEDAATKLIQNCEAAVGIPATYVAATMDLQMADLLKTTRASQIFSVTGAPEIKLHKVDKKSSDGEQLYQVELLGMDIFDAVTMENTHRSGNDVPAWFLDTGYNELAFCVSQAFFPRTAAWDNLKRELRGVYADTVWQHLAGTTSEPFVAGQHKQIAVKVIDDRGNELLIVKKLSEAEQ